MTQTQDLLRGELERLFELDELTSLASELMGYDAAELGGTDGKGAFARALVNRAAADSALEALVDAVVFAGKRSDALAKVFQVRVGHELETGTEVDGFRIVKKLAEGGLGNVYLGEKKSGDEKVRVALKVIRSSLSRDRSAVARYLTSQRAFARKNIDGLATIVACGELEDGRPWVATRFVEGQTLEARIQRVGPMHINEARPIFAGVLEALQNMHDAGLVHSDLKSGNVFMVRPQRDDGTRGEPTGILVDGGAYRLLAGGANRPDALGALRVFGRAEAIAPEMARGDAVDSGSDVYAAGVMLYECLTGRVPFQGASAFEVIAQHLSADPEPPSTHAPKGWVSKELDALVMKALSKKREDRFETARDLLDAILELAKPKVEKKDLDEKAFSAAKKALEKAPSDEEKATALEEVVAPAHEWEKAIEVYRACLEKVEEADDKKALLFRIARLQAKEQGDAEAAEATYRSILELDAEDSIALSGIEELKRAARDHEGLAEVLLEQVEHVGSVEERAGLLREIGEIYEEKLEDPENALVAYTQALADQPSDDRGVRAVERIAGTDQDRWNEVLGSLNEAVQDPADASDAVRIYVLMGGWYADRLKRPDFALPCYAQALQLDASNDDAYEGTITLYEKSQSWQEKAQLLVARADAEENPARARDYRAEAAEVVLRKLSDTDRAMSMFQEVLKDDPSHPTALDALATIHEERKEWKELSELLAERVKQSGGPDKTRALLRLAELYEDRLDDFEKATVHYDEAANHDPASLDALKGLERIFARQNNYQRLLETLEKQLELMATPRQKIAVLEHIGAIQEEEFVDAEKAIAAYEQVVEIDPGNEGANPALARLYRSLGRFDELVATLERHAKASEDQTRKTDLLLQAARALMVDVGAPDRALEICDRIVAIDPAHAEALSLTARLKAQTGDATAAVEAVEKLAETASDDKKKAAHYVEAGKMLEEAGDNDRAIERYKRALDADEENGAAASALRRLYAGRGDAHGAAELLLREIEVASGKSRKAELHAELGALYVERLEDEAKAKDAFETALSLDPTCTPASRGLGDMAFTAGDWAEAVKHYEPLLARTSELEDTVARDVGLRCGDAFRQLEQFSKAQRAYLNAKAFAPDNRDILERVAQVTFAAGEADEAAELYRDLLEKFGDELAPDDKGRYLYRRGDAMLRAGELDEAAKLLDEAAELRPDDPAPLQALRKVYEKQGKHDLVVSTLRRRMEKAGDDERFELLVAVGDVLKDELKDREKAAKSYVAALEIVPDDRNLLTKLMGVYSETKDWSRLVEVILRIAELVDDEKQLSKYYITAASIAHHELGRHDEAADYYEQALDNDPGLAKAFDGLRQCLEKTENHSSLANAYRAHIARNKAPAKSEDLAALYDTLGDLYREKLEDLTQAIECYEAAQELDPESRKRLEMLAEIYEGDPKRYFRKATDTHMALLRKSPYRVESYQALRQLYTDVKRADGSWCVCQTLKVLSNAGPDEEAFFKKHRSRHPAAAEEFFNEDIWFNHLIHPDQDPLLTGIFAAISPAVVASRSQQLSAYDVSASDKRDPASDESVMVQTLGYVAGVTQIELPDVYYRKKDPGGLSILYTEPPAIGVGKGALGGGPAQALAFVAARQLTYFRQGHYLRHLVPSGSGLRAWLLAAIKMVTPQFPVPKSLGSKVDKSLEALKKHVTGETKEQLRQLVQKLLAAAPELDMKKWVAAVDLTADRVGFVMANDLEISAALIKASPEEGMPQKERLKELYLYSVSSAYMQLRQKIGISIDT